MNKTGRPPNPQWTARAVRLFVRVMPLPDDTLMIDPDRRASMFGSTARQDRN
jgi:hypothetical protein